jgi:Flp pilus assembly protein TadD
MPTERQTGSSCRCAFLLLSALIFLIYSNTFDAAWHLDDFPNITESPVIHVNDLDWESLSKPVKQALKDGRFDRPLSRLSFALNWYIGKDAPEGYHAVNLAIHILTACLLFLTARALFRTPNLRGASRQDADFICLLGTVLWAVNPIQTQAVTYIVQRMAAMAAMFCILSMYGYLRARLSGSRVSKAGWAALCLLSFVLGMASKENAAVLPLMLYVIELCFFQDLGLAQTRRRLAVAGLVGGILLLGLGSFIFLKGDPLSVLSYGNRSFSPSERLLTQARVLVFYLSQIFYPAPTRLSIEHDIVVSTSLIDPWSTLASVAIICALIGLAVLQLRKRPLLSFAILFFFVSHLIESSIIGLELVFEHRNYLASMFLFFPVAAGLKSLLDRYSERSRPMVWLLAGFITLLVIGLGTGTYIRNQVWSSGKLLWEDAAGKAPGSSRPLHNLAWDYYERIGDYASALEIYRAALQRTKTNIHQESIILNNMASIYYTIHDYASASEFWRRALANYPGYSEISYRLALALTRLGDPVEAETHLSRLLMQHPAHPYALNLKGILLIRRGQVSEGIRCLNGALKLQPTQLAATINIGAAYMLAGDLQKAEWFFKDACFRFPGDKIGLLWLTWIEVRTGNTVQANHHMHQLLDSVKLSDLLAWMPEGEPIGLLRDSILLPERKPEMLALLYACIGSRLEGAPRLPTK